MSVLENFKNIPQSPYGGRQGSNVIFFLQICNEVPGEKKRGGACRPWGGGDRVLLSASRHSLCHLILKIQEKKEGWGEEKRRSSAELRTPDLQVTSV